MFLFIRQRLMEISHYTSGLNLIFQINTCKGHKHSLPQSYICMMRLAISVTWGEVAPNILPLPCLLLDNWSQLPPPPLFLYPPPSIWKESTVTFLEIVFWHIRRIFNPLLFRPFYSKALAKGLSKLDAGHQLLSAGSSLLLTCPWRTSCRFYFIKQCCLHFQRTKGNMEPPESLHMMIMIKKNILPSRLDDIPISWRHSKVPRLELAVGELCYHRQEQWTHPSYQIGSIGQVLISTVKLETNCAFKKVAFLTLGWLYVKCATNLKISAFSSEETVSNI